MLGFIKFNATYGKGRRDWVSLRDVDINGDKEAEGFAKAIEYESEEDEELELVTEIIDVDDD